MPASLSKNPQLVLPPVHYHRFSIQDRFTRRYYKYILILLTFLGLSFAAKTWRDYNQLLLPPLFPEYHLSELALPQHNPDLPYPEGRTGKYIWLSEHTHDAGWGNILQEHFLNGLLAYSSGRSFVFDNYTWSRDGPYSEYNGHLIPSQIPMTAFINGPLAGGPFAPGDETPRSVLKEYYDEVCPDAKVLDKWAVRATLPGDYSAGTVLTAWLKMMDETPDRCVVIDDSIFDIWIFGSRRLLDVIPALFQSPIITLFRWSPLVVHAVEKNSKLFAPHGLSTSSPTDPYPPIPGLLALHIRRGDFEGHCQHLARWQSSWTGFNLIPGLIDQYDLPPLGANGEITPEVYDFYNRSCYPSVDHILEKVEQVRQTEEGKRLKNVFIMTNGRPEWVTELKTAMKRTGDWERIASSRDMSYSWEQLHVSGAVDILIGQRADVFIGNGFSSLSGNVVMLRMARGLAPGRTRLWC